MLLEDFEIYSYLQGENLLNSKANYDINFYRVSKDVNNPQNNNSNLITMVDTT